MKLKELADYLDSFLEIKKIPDASSNGLQIEGCDDVKKIMLAADFSLKAAEFAAENGCQMILCHHGLFWPAINAITGSIKKRIKTMLDHEISLYGVHLPLDLHGEIGNNAVIARKINAEKISEFASYNGQNIGVAAELVTPVRVDEFKLNFDKIFNTDSLLIKADHGKEHIKTLGIVSGGAARQINDAIKMELDLFITGEPSHSEYHQVKENKTHMLCGGHYRTEVTGIQELGRHLEEKFKLATIFFDLPTGL